MSGPILVDGELADREGPHVSALDRGFRYGDAVFETLRVYNGRPFAWDRHMKRLSVSAKTISLDHGLSGDTLRDYADRTLDANGYDEAYLRIAITRGVQPGTLAPSPVVEPTVVVQVEPLPRGGIHGESVWDDPVTCIIPDTRRMPESVIPAHVKSHNYLNGIQAMIEANEAGADQPLLLDINGHLTEATTANVFLVVDGELWTPDPNAVPVLSGITRAEVIDIASELDIEVVEGVWGPEILETAHEVFLTNTTWEVRPVDAVGNVTFGTGPITERIRRAFNRRIEIGCYGTDDT